MRIADIDIGPGNPCRFIAEISCNHGGSLDRAIRLIDAAKAAQADFCKFQAYTPTELCALRGDGPAPEPWGSAGWTMESLYRKAQTPLDWFPHLFQHAREIGIVPFSSVFGWDSLMCLRAVDNPCYKLASLDRGAGWLFTAVRATERPILVSTPERGLERSSYEWSDIGTLYCPPHYPTVPEDVRLPKHFAEDSRFGYLGLSSHCLTPELPIAAVARGCKLIEMHMQLADEPSELESNVSLTQYAFKEMVDNVRRVETMLL